MPLLACNLSTDRRWPIFSSSSCVLWRLPAPLQARTPRPVPAPTARTSTAIAAPRAVTFAKSARMAGGSARMENAPRWVPASSLLHSSRAALAVCVCFLQRLCCKLLLTCMLHVCFFAVQDCAVYGLRHRLGQFEGGLQQVRLPALDALSITCRCSVAPSLREAILSLLLIHSRAHHMCRCEEGWETDPESGSKCMPQFSL